MKRDPSRLQKVEEVFDHVVGLGPARWSAALDEACGGDVELRAEVESLLVRAHGTSQSLHLTETLQALIPETEPDPNVGRRVGPYEIRRRIGAGGMGNVYLAVQTEPVQRTVALKLIRRGIDTDETILRFSHERQVLASLNHPNIAQFHDAGSTEDGRPYFVMEYVEGEPITSYCDRQGLDTPDRLKLFQQVCAAVHFAHQNAVIHRDLKPANILVTAKAIPKLLDFGVAKLIDQRFSAGAQTRGDARRLTLEYASPEQIRDEAVTTASDVYSMGVILYEMLTGSRPYDLTGRTREEANDMICSGAGPPSPSTMLRRRVENPRRLSTELPDPRVRTDTRSPRQVYRELRGDLDSIALTALNREPLSRYASVEQLSADIQRYLDHQPVLASQPGRIYRLCKFARRNKAGCVVLAVLVLGLVVASSAAVWAIRSQDEVRAQAVRLRRVVYAKEMDLAALDLRANLLSSLQKRLGETPADLRDWEWKYLQSQADNSYQSWTGHEGDVNALVVSPDGLRVVSGGTDNTVRVWEAQDGTPLLVLKGHSGPVNSVDISPDGGQIISAGSDGSVRIWHSRTGLQIAVLEPEAGPVVSVRIGSDGRWIAAGCGDGTIRIWEAQSLVPARTLTGFEGRFDSLSFARDGRHLAGGGKGLALGLWNIEQSVEPRVLGTYSELVCSTAFSPDSKFLGVCLYKGTLHLFDTATWKQSRTPRKSQAISTCSLAFSPDSGRIVSTGRDDRTLTVWDLDSRSRITEFHGHGRRILAAAFMLDGRRIVTGAADKLLKVWDGQPLLIRDKLSAHNAAVRSLAFSPDGRILLTGGSELVFWDMERRHAIRSLRAHGAEVLSVAFAASGQCFVTGGGDGLVRVWDGSTAVLRREIAPHEGPVSSLAISADGNHIVSGGSGNVLQVWVANTGEMARRLEGHTGPVRFAAYSGDGQHILSGSVDGTLRIWNPRTGSVIRTFSGHIGKVHCGAFSPDGRWMASGGEDGTLRVWNAATGASRLVVRELHVPIVSTCFSPDGKRVISGDADGAVRLWDVQTGAETFSFLQHDGPVNAIAFSSDGLCLVTGGEDRLVVMRKTVPYPVEAETRRSIPAHQAQATELLQNLFGQIHDWSQVATAIREDATLSSPVRRRALTQIIADAPACVCPVADWDVVFFPLPAVSGPQEVSPTEAEWEAASKGTGLVRERPRTIDFGWGTAAPAPGVPPERFGMVATGTVRTQSGRYRVATLSDDGVRVWVDGRQVLSNWTAHAEATDQAEMELAEGEHSVRVEYFQATGQARLRLCLELSFP